MAEYVEPNTCKSIREDQRDLCEEKHRVINAQMLDLGTWRKDTDSSIMQLVKISERTAATMELLVKDKVSKESSTTQNTQVRLWQTKAFERIVTYSGLSILLMLVALIGKQLLDILPVIDKLQALLNTVK